MQISCSDQVRRPRKWRSAMDTNDTQNSSDHQPIEAPNGVDLNPQPQRAVRISRRASMAIVSVIVLLLIAFAYGGYRRTLTNQAAARDAGLPRNVDRNSTRLNSSHLGISYA